MQSEIRMLGVLFGRKLGYVSANDVTWRLPSAYCLLAHTKEIVLLKAYTKI
jgi:hypothetical protein